MYILSRYVGWIGLGRWRGGTERGGGMVCVCLDFYMEHGSLFDGLGYIRDFF